MSGKDPQATVLRTFHKKLKDIAVLEQKQKDGATLDAGQLAKLASKAEVSARVAELEAEIRGAAASKAGPSDMANKQAGKAGPPAPGPSKGNKSSTVSNGSAPMVPGVEEGEEIDDTANPYRRQVRNLRKKLDIILTLEARVKEGLTPNEDQKKKLASKSAIQKDLANYEQQSHIWTTTQLQLLKEVTQPSAAQAKPSGSGNQVPKAKASAAPKTAAPKSEPKAKEEAPAPTVSKTEVPVAQEDEPEPKPQVKVEPKPQPETAKPKEKVAVAQPAKGVEKAPPSLEGPKAPKAAAKADKPEPKAKATAADSKPSAPSSGSQPMDDKEEIPEELKPFRNKVRNLQKKLNVILELKRKPMNELDAEQQKKVKTEAELRKDLQHATDLYNMQRVKFLG